MFYKKKMMFAGTLTVLAILGSSCKKEVIPSNQGEEERRLANVILRISNPTKATGSNHNSQIDDNQVNSVAIFVFNKDAAKTLETYKFIRIPDQSALEGINFQTTTGNKNIYVIANCHDSTQWTGIVREDDFLLKESNLKDENLKDFAMSGKIDNAQIDLSNMFNITLKRVVAKIILNSVKTDFQGTPYYGMQLGDVKFYLTNVHKVRPFIENNITSNPLIINSLKNIPSTYYDCRISGLVCDIPGIEINDIPYTEKHHFYAYENSIQTETVGEKFTKLVIEATLDGNTYYYPIDINREDYGGTTNNGIKRNTVYNLSVIIKRPGSNSPSIMVEKGTVITTVTVADWENENMGNIEF